MKKFLIFILFSFSVLSFSFSEADIPFADALIPSGKLPEVLDGIWEGSDRYIMFQENSELDEILDSQIQLDEPGYIWCYLKMFYGWYTDRAAEKTNRKNSSYQYDTNDVVFRDIQNIKIEFVPLLNLENCSAFEIVITYPNVKEKYSVPVAVIGDSLFLDFAIRQPQSDSENIKNRKNNNDLYGFWSSVPEVSGIKISRPVISDSLYSMYVADDCVYYIRYWQTDMEFSDGLAVFSDGKNKYEVPKHIKSSGKIFTCVNGRSSIIRNVERKALPLENYDVNDDKNIIGLGTPYLSRIEKKCSLENMMKIVMQDNSRRAPYPDPPFPPSNLDWHLDDITRLEINNQIIQAVRRRQREFYEKYQLGLKF